MKLSVMDNNKKKKVIGVFIIILVIAIAVLYVGSYAKYQYIENVELVKGDINYKPYDYRIAYINVNSVVHTCDTSNKCEEMKNYLPGSNYSLNSNSYCQTKNSSGTYIRDNSIVLNYQNGVLGMNVTKKKARCYLYFDLKDMIKPTISNVATSVTKTEINVTVTASDNVGVTEYWYAIDSGSFTKGTGNTHKFTGLTAGSTHTVKVYVKDAAGNQSDTSSKTVTTTPNGITMDTIIAGLNAKTTTPTFSNAATTDEGVYRVSDGMYGGNSYYWRGAATTNYVKFAGKCWRIIRINGDKTMRLIYDGATCHANGTSTADSIAVASTAYNSSYNRSEYVGWKYTSGSQRPSSITSGTNAPIKTTLENWYNSNIGNNTTYASKVADGKYCNDRNVQSGQSWASAPSSTFYYAAYKRIYTDRAPSLSCASLDTYSLKLGLITADEVMYAGGLNTNNTSYYLYNGQNYWTMSPYSMNVGTSGGWAGVFFVRSSGYLDWYSVNGATLGVRPVINLKADTLFVTGGTGTRTNPYVVL